LESFLATANNGASMNDYAPWLRHSFLTMWAHSFTPTGNGWITVGDVEDFSFNYDLEPSTFQVERADAAGLGFYMNLFVRAGMDEEASWAKHFMQSLPRESDSDRIYAMMADHDDLPAVDHRTAAPTVQLDSGFDVLFDRTSWSANASFLLARAGWSGVDHTHGDVGHFQLFRRGRWITHEAIGYDGIAADAAGHNVLSMQVGGPDDEPRVTQYRYGPGNTQRIIRADSRPAHTLLVADTTGVYTSYEGLSYDYDVAQRSILWIKGDEQSADDLIVVYDLVDATRDGLTKQWTTHWDVAPDIDGQRATFVLPAPGGDQHVAVDIVSPAGATLSARTPSGTPDEFPSTLYTHGLEVDPGTDATLRMVAVVRAADSAAPIAVEASAVNSNEFHGALSGDELVVFPAAPIPATLSGGSVSVDHEGPLRAWITGLTPDAAYDVTVTRNGATIAIAISTGTEFQADASGLIAANIDTNGTVTSVY
jgi:hypothetical protein